MSMMSQKFRNLLRYSSKYLPSWGTCFSQDVRSTVNLEKNRFQAELDVHEFSPEEITVKASENTVTVEAKHEEKQDEYGYIFRHFVRKYVIPEGHEVNKIESKLSSDGMLTITAPRSDWGKKEERKILVVQTGLPSKTVEDKKDRRKKQYQIL